ncbi:LppX_LprAFG lipoprotein [Streptomyces sp. NPDC001480]|uniref:LppX_LprAFG lipoprotein n=1 Tax=Streptomyces sp. NPDC001480 TaxID=3364577 RepID=UPI0036A27F2D
MRPSAGAAALAVLLAGGAAGCAQGDDPAAAPATPAAAVARAAEKTGGLTSLRYRATGRIPGEGRIRAVGSYKANASGVTTRVIGGAHPGTTELRLVDGVLYGSARKPLHGRHWICYGSLERGKLDDFIVLNTRNERDEAGRNPAREAAFLTAAKHVKDAGTETVDGVRTTHYTGTAGLDAIDAEVRPGKSLRPYRTMGVDELTLDLWVGPDDRARQVRLRGRGHHGELDLTLTFLAYDGRVTVEAPAASDTSDLTGRLKPVRG